MNAVNVACEEDSMASIRQLTQSIKELVLQLEREVGAMRPSEDTSAGASGQSGSAAGVTAAAREATALEDAAGEEADRALAELLKSVPAGHVRFKVRAARSAATQLSVRIGGEAICRPRSTDTFVEALRKIGLERVRDLDLQLSGVPLVSSRRPVGYQNTKRVDGVYVVTHASNRTKKQILERIAGRLGVAIEVEIMGKHQWRWALPQIKRRPRRMAEPS